MRKYLPNYRPTLAEVRARDLELTEHALHDAKMELERAQASVAMFEARRNRLKGEQNENN